MISIILSAVLFVWAGVAIGGNMIAAPAKFSVDALEMPIALLVGRAQFLWIGYAEAMLAAAAIGLALAVRGNVLLVVLPALILGAQWFVLMPLLNARSDMIIGGSAPSSSVLHFVFIGVEFAKIVTLLGAGFWMCRRDSLNLSVAQ